MTNSTTDESAPQTHQPQYPLNGIVGKIINNRYEIQRYLGRGGFGVEKVDQVV